MPREAAAQPSCASPGARAPGLKFSPSDWRAPGQGWQDSPAPDAALEAQVPGPGSELRQAPTARQAPAPPRPPPTRAPSLCLFVLALSLTLYLIIRRREAESSGPRSLITAALVSAGGGGGIRRGRGKQRALRVPSLSALREARRVEGRSGSALSESAARTAAGGEGLAWNGERWLGLSACSAPENPSSQRQRQRQHSVSPDGPARTRVGHPAGRKASSFCLSLFSPLSASFLSFFQFPALHSLSLHHSQSEAEVVS